jgi:hypothetical protein
MFCQGRPLRHSPTVFVILAAATITKQSESCPCQSENTLTYRGHDVILYTQEIQKESKKKRKEASVAPLAAAVQPVTAPHSLPQTLRLVTMQYIVQYVRSTTYNTQHYSSGLNG